MATSFTPTLYQHLATDYQRNLAVTAGAGTGKTAVLTQRIIKILTEEKHFLDRLLVVTFTDKAAVEMKERIYRALEEELKKTGSSHLQQLKDTFFNNYISTFHSFCASLLREYPIEAGLDPYFRVLDETDKIFFLRKVITQSLQELARDAKNPDIQITSSEFSKGALTEALFTMIQRREDTGDWISEFPRLQWEEYRERLNSYRGTILREMAYKLYRSKSLDTSLQQIEETLSQVEGDTSALTRKRDRLLNLIPLFLKRLETSTTGPIHIEEIERLKEEIIKNAKMAGAPPKVWRGEPYETIKGIFLKIRYLLESFDLESFSITESHEKRGFALLQALGRLTQYSLKAYHIAKERENYLDFQDLQLKVIQLLESKRYPHIVKELKERYLYLMVDEFQDTNDLQWRIIKCLATEPSGVLLHPKLFVVGDEKQAIYSFRGGDVSLFCQVREELKRANLQNRLDLKPFELLLKGEKDYSREYSSQIIDDREVRKGEIVFAHNFRSAKTPIHFFNLFFYDLLYKEVYEDFDARPQSLLCSGNTKKGSIELLLVDNSEELHDEGEDQEIEPHYKEALLIVDKLKEVFLGDDEKYQNVRKRAEAGEPACAILLNRRTKLKTYEEALRINHIDFTVVRGKGFYQRQEIVDIGNLLCFLTDPSASRALLGFLRSPVCHLSDEAIFLIAKKARGSTLWDQLQYICKIEGEVDYLSLRDSQALQQTVKRLTQWLGLSKRLSLMESLHMILNEGGYYASLSRGSRGQQAVSNIDKLLDSARDLSLQEGMDLADFSEWLDNRIDFIEEEGEAAMDISLGGAVQIMTVHQAKGLEFPLVFVPDMGARFNLGEKNAMDVDALPYSMEVVDGEIRREEIVELGLDAPNPENDWEAEPLLVKRIIKKRRREKLIAEKKRLLYVAATRAMDHLILVGNSKFSSQRIIDRILYAPLDDLTNWMDWCNKIFSLSFTTEENRGEITYTNKGGESMTIPYRKFMVEDLFLGSHREYRTEFPLD